MFIEPDSVFPVKFHFEIFTIIFIRYRCLYYKKLVCAHSNPVINFGNHVIIVRKNFYFYQFSFRPETK